MKSENPSAACVEAEALLELANADPAAVAADGPALAERSVAGGDPAAAAIACRAVGLATARLDRVAEALAWLARGHELAESAGDPQLRANVDVTYAAVLSWSGDPRAALALLDAALDDLDGLAVARARAQRGQILLRTGRFRAALADLDAALPELDEGGDEVWRARALTNRGLVRTYVGSLDEAESDLLAAKRAYEARGAAAYVAETLDNLGWASAQRGDIVRALGYFDDAEALLRRLRYPLGQLLRDRSEALLAAHLVGEALSSARRAAEELRDSGQAAGYLEALVTLARAALAADEHALAAEAADEVAARAAHEGRPALAWHGRLLALEARRAAGEDPPAPGAAAEAARRLAAIGLATPALTARLLAVELALDAGRLALAERWLAEIPAAAHNAPLAVRVRTHLARARFHAAAGRHAAAARALAAGMGVVEDHQAGLGATETRAAVAGFGAELGRLGMELAARSRRPRRLLAWMERTRASALRFPSAAPPADGEFAAGMAQLRWVEANLREETDPRRAARLDRQRGRLEADLARRARRLGGAGGAVRPATVADLIDALGASALVMYGEIHGSLHAVVAHHGRARHHELGAVAEVRDRLVRLRGALRRVGALGRGAEPARPLVGAAGDRRALDDGLLRPLRLPADAPLVVIPTPGMFSVPWALLDTARGRPLTVAPSGASWLACSGRSVGSRVLLANGPRLEYAARETAAVAAVYDRPTRLTSRAATVERVRGEIGRHDVVHLAAHGALRADNPQFSSLELTDGPLNVFDLESVGRAPDLMVLSACDSGLAAALPGNEIMGLVACVLGQGAGAVVAGVGLVPDARRTTTFMRRFHERVAAGDRPAVALAALTAQIDTDDLADAALGGFVCFGGS